MKADASISSSRRRLCTQHRSPTRSDINSRGNYCRGRIVFLEPGNGWGEGGVGRFGILPTALFCNRRCSSGDGKKDRLVVSRLSSRFLRLPLGDIACSGFQAPAWLPPFPDFSRREMYCFLLYHPPRMAVISFHGCVGRRTTVCMFVVFPRTHCRVCLK